MAQVVRRHSLLHIPQGQPLCLPDDRPKHKKLTQRQMSSDTVQQSVSVPAPPVRSNKGQMKKFKRKLSFSSLYNSIESSFKKRERRRTISSSGSEDSARGSPQRKISTDTEPESNRLHVPDRFKRLSSGSDSDQDALRVAILYQNHRKFMNRGETYNSLPNHRKAVSHPDVRRPGDPCRTAAGLEKTKSAFQVCHHSDCQDRNHHRPLQLCSDCDRELHSSPRNSGHLRFDYQERAPQQRRSKSDDDIRRENEEEEYEDDDANSVSSGSETTVNKIRRKKAFKGQRLAGEEDMEACQRSQSLQELPHSNSSTSDLAADAMNDISEETETEPRQCSFYLPSSTTNPTRPGSDVFEEAADSGTEDEVAKTSDNDAVTIAPSPMETQGPRRLKKTALIRDRKQRDLGGGSSRIRKGSVPAHRQHRDFQRKVSLGTEYFTVHFDVLDENDVQVVAAAKGVTLRDAILPALENRSVNIDAVDVFLSSSKTALPKDGDSYHFGGSNLHIRGRDGEYPLAQRVGSLSSLPGSTRTHSALGSTRSLAEKTRPVGSQRSRKTVASSLDDSSGQLNDVSPLGTLRAMDTSTLRSKGGAKGSSKLSTLFSPFQKGTDKHEQLTDHLTELLLGYSQNGIPVMPELLNIGAQEYDDEQFRLDGHWKDHVDHHQNLSKCQKDHQEAIWELLKTELDYIRKVKVIIDLFMSCLYNLQNESIFNEIKTEMVFSNIRDVYQANCDLWVNYMLPVVQQHRQTKQPLSASRLKEGFLKFEEIMHPYTKYCLEYDTCKEYIRKTREKNDLFDRFLTWAESNEQCSRWKLEDLIVAPWQRLTKYHLLLKAVRKPIEGDDVLKRDLSDMIEVVDHFGAQVNRVMKQQGEHERLSNIIDRIEAYDAIEAPNDECMKLISEYTRVESLLTCQLPGCGPQEFRNLLREGGLKLKEPFSRMEVHCFLFTDMLLITKPSRRGDKVKVIKPPMRLDKIMVHSLRDGASFLLLYLNEYHVASAVYTMHGEGSKSWLDAIKRAQADYEKKRLAFMDRMESSVLDFSLSEGNDCFFHSRVRQVRERSPDSVSRQDSTGSTDTFLPSLNVPRSASFAEDGNELQGHDVNRPRSATFGSDSSRSKSPRGHPALHQHAHSISECYVSTPPESPGGRRDMQCQTHISYPSLTSLHHLHNDTSSEKLLLLQQRPELIYDENLRSKLNQRRMGRGEKRYYTADAIQDLQKDKDTSIHKRLSWNFGTTVDIQIDERTGVLKGFSSDSLRSVPSSSGVSSTGSLHLSPDTELCEEVLGNHRYDIFRYHSETVPESNENESELSGEEDSGSEEGDSVKSTKLDSKKALSKSMPDICDVYQKLNVKKSDVQDGIGSVEIGDKEPPKHRKKPSQNQLLRLKKQLLLTNSTVEASEV